MYSKAWNGDSLSYRTAISTGKRTSYRPLKSGARFSLKPGMSAMFVIRVMGWRVVVMSIQLESHTISF